ncbi:hypothetical protein KIL84_007053 [Mauremys mutica]|uniref:Uncharacterized protein n=1 Tax=Mauremys mutica TaxID=74926 RepID=A0A9D4AWR1_9SAUR|nr:hypothetical protein KIL84_007053 [Mauremys mutica]
MKSGKASRAGPCCASSWAQCQLHWGREGHCCVEIMADTVSVSGRGWYSLSPSLVSQCLSQIEYSGRGEQSGHSWTQGRDSLEGLAMALSPSQQEVEGKDLLLRVPMAASRRALWVRFGGEKVSG